MKRRDFLAAVPASVLLSQVGIAKPAPTKKRVMMMNRIAPSVSELYVAGLDGSGEDDSGSVASAEEALSRSTGICHDLCLLGRLTR